MKDFFAAIIAILAVIALIAGISFGGYYSYAYFAPRYTAVDAKVFKESVQYNDGMIRDLSELQQQYETSDADTKATLKPIIIHRFEVYDENRLPSDMRRFYDSLKSNVN